MPLSTLASPCPRAACATASGPPSRRTITAAASSSSSITSSPPYRGRPSPPLRGAALGRSRRAVFFATEPAMTSPRLSSLDETTRPTFTGLHHVGLLVANLEASLDFYCGVLGLSINPDRPDAKLPYRGAWLMVGPDMIHLMELPNPDPLSGRPEHGGRDRHACVGVADADALAARLDAAGIPFTRSASGRPAIFFRDPDANVLECAEVGTWR